MLRKSPRQITGDLLIAGQQRRGSKAPVQALRHETGQALVPLFGGADVQDLEDACEQAWSAYLHVGKPAVETRAALLEGIGRELLQEGEAIVARVVDETGLPHLRATSELERTIGQLHQFSRAVRDGFVDNVVIDQGAPPRPVLRREQQPLGPIAVFGASNVPLAFSVAGGDTASALAAGCPVIVKAHPAHPGVSELVGRCVAAAVEQVGLPGGFFSLLHDRSVDIGVGLVSDPRVRGVGFTGSRQAGLALAAAARARHDPIPVYAELSSVNPVVILPEAMAKRAACIGTDFAKALTQSVGQFCTNPGLVLFVQGAGAPAFFDALVETLAHVPAQPMLTPAIAAAYRKGVAAWAQDPDLTPVTVGTPPLHCSGAPAVFATTGARLLARPGLACEVFGPAALLVACSDLAELGTALRSLEGQLTASLFFDAGDEAALAPLRRTAEIRAGRVIANGFGVGVDVSPAMVHGGPFPATLDGQSTAVGVLAVRRFQRPVCYQGFDRP